MENHVPAGYPVKVEVNIQWDEPETDCWMCQPFSRCFCAEVLFCIGLVVQVFATILMDP